MVKDTMYTDSPALVMGPTDPELTPADNLAAYPATPDVCVDFTEIGNEAVRMATCIPTPYSDVDNSLEPVNTVVPDKQPEVIEETDFQDGGPDTSVGTPPILPPNVGDDNGSEEPPTINKSTAMYVGIGMFLVLLMFIAIVYTAGKKNK